MRFYSLEPAYSGRIDYNAQQITLIKGAREATKRALWHECVHGMLEALGMREHDEQLVDGLAHQLLLFVKDNPAMFARDEA